MWVNDKRGHSSLRVDEGKGGSLRVDVGGDVGKRGSLRVNVG